MSNSDLIKEESTLRELYLQWSLKRDQQHSPASQFAWLRLRICLSWFSLGEWGADMKHNKHVCNCGYSDFVSSLAYVRTTTSGSIFHIYKSKGTTEMHG